ncbi:MAG: DUF3224 domain-containing protein [Thermoanaerobaculia bacterium]
MSGRAEGTFDVKVVPVDEKPFPDGLTLGRYSLDKEYHGALEGTGTGEMLTGATPVEGAGAYVAMERVEGTLDGRRGSFLLQHRGTMGRGEQHLEITVLRDSGTGELAGIEGTLEIVVEGGEHRYVLEYTLAGID